jgi:RimJ/RimL family protein N-acetyltransferase
MNRVTYPPIRDAHAELLLSWRTRPDITRFMFTDIEPDIVRQRAWLAASAARADFVHRLIALDDTPVGYASITVTDPAARIGTVGVYVADLKARTGPAGLNFIHVLNHAFFVLGLNKIENQILGGNERLVRAQPFNGYRPVGILRQHALKHGVLHDVHLFELLRADWLVFRRRFKDWTDLDGRSWPDPDAAENRQS